MTGTVSAVLMVLIVVGAVYCGRRMALRSRAVERRRIDRLIDEFKGDEKPNQ